MPVGRFFQPRIEAEIAFVMKSLISDKDVTRDAVLAVTDYLAPPLEILDTRNVRIDLETGLGTAVLNNLTESVV